MKVVDPGLDYGFGDDTGGDIAERFRRELDSDAGYGQITMTDGRLVYFHQNSVADARFDDLAVGDTVALHIHPGEGERGPQASVVRPIGGLKYDPGAR